MTDEGTETLEDILDADRGKSWVYLLLKGGEFQVNAELRSKSPRC